jgi:hypothetical protein
MRRLLVSAVLILTFVALFPARSMADTICDANNVCVTLATTSLTETEGSNPFTFPVTVSNKSGQTIFATSFTLGLVSAATPDPTDILEGSSYTNGTCFPDGTVAAGSSCTFSLSYLNPSDPGETDSDFGVTTITDALGVFYFLGGFNSQEQETPGFTLTLTMTDVPVPEPSTIGLLGTGLLGLMGMGFYKKRLA